uniref:Uncharacterized protein n=1 Tax=Oryza sativa subsp. japonica TaxID=39947 RepID=Q2R195_ORYSJ|nr:hypothetical protein LOC_Os11g39929 [Oryza sativa Japonica Group]
MTLDLPVQKAPVSFSH